MSELASMGRGLAAAVIGASGGIGAGLVDALATDPAVDRIFAVARTNLTDLPAKTQAVHLDLTAESSIEQAAKTCANYGELDIVLVASGLLHAGPDLQPEKTWADLSAESFAQSFAINCTGPALVAKHFLPLLARGRKSVFAALSARVGSIGDNRLGGWYGYRASKAALNMVIRTLAVELKRKNASALCIGLHPGTVDTNLSAPFQSRVPAKQLFTPASSAQRLLSVIALAQPSQSGSLLAWDGTEITP